MRLSAVRGMRSAYSLCGCTSNASAVRFIKRRLMSSQGHQTRDCLSWAYTEGFWRSYVHRLPVFISLQNTCKPFCSLDTVGNLRGVSGYHNYFVYHCCHGYPGNSCTGNPQPRNHVGNPPKWLRHPTRQTIDILPAEISLIPNSYNLISTTRYDQDVVTASELLRYVYIS
jgi:hypothetical protein